MPINIKNREAESLLAELKEDTGRGTTEIVLELMRREVARRRKLREISLRRRRAKALIARYRARLPACPESPDDIIGYDEHGLPR